MSSIVPTSVATIAQDPSLTSPAAPPAESTANAPPALVEGEILEAEVCSNAAHMITGKD